MGFALKVVSKSWGLEISPIYYEHSLPRSRFLDVTGERCMTSKKRLQGRLL